MSKYNRVWTVEAHQISAPTKEDAATPVIHDHDAENPVNLRDRRGNLVTPQPGQWVLTHPDGGIEVVDDATFLVNYAPVIVTT